MESTAASIWINNTLVRFGYTVGHDDSVAKEGTVRDIVKAILNGETNLPGNLCPLGIPDDVCEVIISEYQKYDQLRELSEYWRSKAEEKSFPWNGKLVPPPCWVPKCFSF